MLPISPYITGCAVQSLHACLLSDIYDLADVSCVCVVCTGVGICELCIPSFAVGPSLMEVATATVLPTRKAG